MTTNERKVTPKDLVMETIAKIEQNAMLASFREAGLIKHSPDLFSPLRMGAVLCRCALEKYDAIATEQIRYLSASSSVTANEALEQTLKAYLPILSSSPAALESLGIRLEQNPSIFDCLCGMAKKDDLALGVSIAILPWAK